MLYWPYDEITLKTGRSATEILIESPWLQLTVNLTASQVVRAEALVAKYNPATPVSPEYLTELNWFFSSLSKYPLCYVLPRQVWGEKINKHGIRNTTLLGKNAREFLLSSLKDSEFPDALIAVSKEKLFVRDWKWEVEGAIQFSTSPLGTDPLSLFTVARRYQLLDALENDTASQLYECVNKLKANSDKLKKASALVVRQSEYVTEKCSATLSAALGIAQDAKAKLTGFIQTESGHHHIVSAALELLQVDAKKIPVVSPITVLMELLKVTAGRNFLAFAIAVDFLERSVFKKSDPLGQTSKQCRLDVDIGDDRLNVDENVALGFLTQMGPVDKEYAEEALRLAEAITNVMNLVPAGMQAILEKTDYMR